MSYLPNNSPPWQTVSAHFRHFLPQGYMVSPAHSLTRSQSVTGREQSQAGCGDHRCGFRVTTGKESAGICASADRCVKDHRRYILVDTPGFLLAVYVIPAGPHDGKDARCLYARPVPLLPRLKELGAVTRVPRAALILKWLSGNQARVASAPGQGAEEWNKPWAGSFSTGE